MRSRLGVMQGRLSPPINGKIQAFPVQTWQLEFQTAYNLELGGIEWTIDSHNFWGHPLIDIQKSHLVQNLHIYDRHFDAVSELLHKEPLNIQPKLILKENKNFYHYTIDDFEIVGTEGISKLNSKLELAI